MDTAIEVESPYDISVAARLTGLSASNLRMWEKRYGVVEPDRSENGRRIYEEEDVHRLTLLKSLTDRGHAIRNTFNLSIDELEQLLLETASAEIGEGTSGDGSSSSDAGCRIAVVGEYLGAALEAATETFGDAAIISSYTDLDDAAASAGDDRADLLLVECPTLFSNTVTRVQSLVKQSGAIRAILVYHYSQSQTVQALEDGLSRITPVQAPVSPRELEILCAADIALANRKRRKMPAPTPPARGVAGEIPRKQFSSQQLAKLSQISSSVDCECPNHLANLVNNLFAFEKYSAECESRDEADAEMHAYLHKTTAQARATMEDALKALVEFEQIDVGA